MANEIDEMEKFLKLAPSASEPVTSNAEIKLGNGEIHNTEESNETKEESKDENVPNESGEAKVENGEETEEKHDEGNEEEAEDE